MMLIIKYWRLWMKNLALEIQAEMMYKVNLFFKIIALIISDIIAPLITLLIYKNTPGIPGWSFEQFILFQGTFILIFGLAHTTYLNFPGKVIEAVRNGTFDRFLVKPINPLIQITLSSWDIEGLAEVITGLALIIWSLQTISFSTMSLAGFILFIIIANIFLYSLMIIISALAFLVVKSWALYDLFFKLSDFGRYPLTIYEGSLRFFLTFLFPIGIVSTYPSMMLMGTLEENILIIIIPIITLFLLSLWLWHLAMKKHTSAGG